MLILTFFANLVTLKTITTSYYNFRTSDQTEKAKLKKNP